MSTYHTIDAGYGTSSLDNYTYTGITVLDRTNTANYTGVITSVSIRCNANGYVYVGAFTGTSAAHHYTSVYYTGSGATQTFTGLSIPIYSGDYFGCYFPTMGGGIYDSGGTNQTYMGTGNGMTGSLSYSSQNVAGVFYATGVTVPSTPTGVTASDTAGSSYVVISWSSASGASSYKVYRNGSLLTSGVTGTSYNDTSAAAPSINTGTPTASDGTSTTHVVLGFSASPSVTETTYTYSVIATNAAGDSDSSSTDTGKRAGGSLSYLWYMSADDSNADYSSTGQTSSSVNYTGAPEALIAGGISSASQGDYKNKVVLGISSQSITALARYFKCYLSSSGCTSQYTSANRGYRGTGTLTYQWMVSAGDSDASYSNITDATTASYDYTDAPSNGDGRYYKCAVSASDTTTKYSTAARGYVKATARKFIIYI